MLSLMRSVDEAMPPPEDRSAAEQEARRSLEQRLELRSAELQALRTRLHDAVSSSSKLSSLSERARRRSLRRSSSPSSSMFCSQMLSVASASHS